MQGITTLWPPDVDPEASLAPDDRSRPRSVSSPSGPEGLQPPCGAALGSANSKGGIGPRAAVQIYL